MVFVGVIAIATILLSRRLLRDLRVLLCRQQVFVIDADFFLDRFFFNRQASASSSRVLCAHLFGMSE